MSTCGVPSTDKTVRQKQPLSEQVIPNTGGRNDKKKCDSKQSSLLCICWRENVSVTLRESQFVRMYFGARCF